MHSRIAIFTSFLSRCVWGVGMSPLTQRLQRIVARNIEGGESFGSEEMPAGEERDQAGSIFDEGVESRTSQHPTQEKRALTQR